MVLCVFLSSMHIRYGRTCIKRKDVAKHNLYRYTRLVIQVMRASPGSRVTGLRKPLQAVLYTQSFPELPPYIHLHEKSTPLNLFLQSLFNILNSTPRFYPDLSLLPYCTTTNSRTTSIFSGISLTSYNAALKRVSSL